MGIRISNTTTTVNNAKIPNKIYLTTKNTEVSGSYNITPANYTID